MLSALRLGVGMRRRDFIQLMAGSAALPLIAGAMPALAQTPNRVYRLGHLGNAAPSEASARQITLPELARLGYVEGRNLVFDARIGESDALPGLMRELLAATGRRHRRWRRGDHGRRHRDAYGADRDLRRRPD